MAKKESTFINMVVALFIVTLVAAGTLGGVYEATKEPIAKAKLEKKLNAIKAVVPEFTNNPNADKYEIPVENGDPIIAYPANSSNELVGTALETYTMAGFSGLIKLMVGLNTDGSINNISVLEHKETPGLGTHMSDDWFIAQFKGKNPGTNNIKVTKDQGEIDAITAATISSRAFSDAVQRAYDSYKSYKPKTEITVADTTLNEQNQGGEDESVN